jgi:hypothetical protein
MPQWKISTVIAVSRRFDLFADKRVLHRAKVIGEPGGY